MNRRRLRNFRFGDTTYDTPEQMASKLGYAVKTVKAWLRAGYTDMAQVEYAKLKHWRRRNSR